MGCGDGGPSPERGGEPIPARGRRCPGPPTPDGAEGAAAGGLCAQTLPSCGRNRRVSLSSRDRRAREEPEGGSRAGGQRARWPKVHHGDAQQGSATGRWRAPGGGSWEPSSPSCRRRRRESRAGYRGTPVDGESGPVSAVRAGAPRRPVAGHQGRRGVACRRLPDLQAGYPFWVGLPGARREVRGWRNRLTQEPGGSQEEHRSRSPGPYALRGHEGFCGEFPGEMGTWYCLLKQVLQREEADGSRAGSPGEPGSQWGCLLRPETQVWVEI